MFFRLLANWLPGVFRFWTAAGPSMLLTAAQYGGVCMFRAT
jgi:hypothetical protein